MNAHRRFDLAQAEAEAVEQRVRLAVAKHRGGRGEHEQLELDIELEPAAPADYGVAVTGPAGGLVVTRSSIGQRPNWERAAWQAYRRRVLPVLWERQGGVCALCGWPIDLEVNGRRPEGASVDHVYPLHAGGALIPESDELVRLVHHACNSARGNRLQRRSSCPGSL